MQCRAGCGACCIAPSITSAYVGMPNGKLAGERCVHLNVDNLCLLFNDARRPDVCEDFKASKEFCGDSYDQAMEILSWLEIKTGV